MLPFLLFLSVFSLRADFIQDWQQMRNGYQKIMDLAERYSLNAYCVPHWTSATPPIRNMILGDPRKNFLDFSIPAFGWMAPRDYTAINVWQSIFLQDCVSKRTKMLWKRASDHLLAGLPFNSPEGYSANSLQHMYYIARLLEAQGDSDIDTIIEIGGGYGNLMRLFKQIMPGATVVMFDMPEMAAIQFLYLKTTLPNAKVILHTTVPENFEKGAIHILPVFFIDCVDFKSDAFISTFALTEASELLQKKVIEKSFFGADVCFVNGQINGWGGTFVGHEMIHKAMREQFDHVVCSPVPGSTQKLKSFEMIACHR